MNVSRFACAIALLAASSGCAGLGDGLADEGVGGNGAESTGDTSGSGAGAGGSKYGEDTTSTSSGVGGDWNGGDGGASPEPGTGGSDGEGGQGSLSGCDTCCEQEPRFGGQPFYMRVDDSSSFASPLLTRALVDTWDGSRPLPVRAHEYLNFYPPTVPSLGDDATFAWSDGAKPIALASRTNVFALQVAVRHEARATTTGRTIALVVDTSPSAEAAVDALLGSVDTVFHQLDAADMIGVYSWSSDPVARLIRPLAPVADVDAEIDLVRSTVLAQLAERDPSTSLGEPLQLALDDVRDAGQADVDGTVVLVSDGSVGLDEGTLDAITDAANDVRGKVRVLGVGVGDARYYSDEVLDRITDASGGAYVYFDGSDQARSLLGDRFRELSEVVASDVRLRVELPKSMRLVRADDAGIDDVELGSAEQVEGQNIGWSGTMTFHQPIEWSGEPGTECDALTWHVVRGRTSTDEGETSLASGFMVVGDVFGWLHVTDSMLQTSAVMAAADALRGPTQTRMSAAFASLSYAFAPLDAAGLWADSGLPDLCATLLRACERKGFSCGSCDFDANAGGGSTP